MFKIHTRRFGTFTEYVLSNLTTGEYLCVLPAFGGVLTQLVLRKNKSRHALIQAPATQQQMQENHHYASALMYPFPSRIPGGLYQFEGKMYQLYPNETARQNAMHGFVHPKAFEVIAQNTSKNEALLTINHAYLGEYEGYPFPFELRITYLLSATGFDMTHAATNTAATAAPAAFGWHPYFKIDSTPTDEMQIEIPSDTVVTFNDQMIPTGQQPFERSRMFDLQGVRLDNCFVLDAHTGTTETKLIVKKQDLTLKIRQEVGVGKFNFLVIYTPPSRTSVAIEPLTCNVNAFNTGDGLVVLQAGQTLSGHLQVVLE